MAAREGFDLAATVAIGKVVSANNVQVTIVGVLPAAFTGVQQPIGEPSDISFPVSLDPQLTGLLLAAARRASINRHGGGCR